MEDASGATLQITIPFPTEIAGSRGIDSTRGPNGIQLNFRALEFENDKFALAASVIGLTKSEYIRRVMNDVSDVVLQMYKEDFKPLDKYKTIRAIK